MNDPREEKLISHTSRKALLMTDSTHQGAVVLSVDLIQPLTKPQSPGRRRLRTTVNDLLQSMHRFDICATWAVSPAATQDLVPLIGQNGDDHEFGISGDSAWLSETNQPALFALELCRRVAQFRQLGLNVSSVLLTDVGLPTELDVFAKHGITAIRGSSPRRHQRARHHGPKMIRFGIWYEPVDARIPGVRDWLGKLGRPYRLAARAARIHGTAHITIDAADLAERGAAAMRVVQRLIGYVASLRDQRRVIVSTLADAARRGRRSKAASPTRSILRPAA
jgi:hypothetical protein